MAQPSQRPISPHLGVYKWGPHMAVSILHRATGDGMSLVGAMGLIWWLYALAAGGDTYAEFLTHASAWYGQVVLIGLTWSLLQHLFSGLRHFVLDTGAGYELDSNRTWSIFVLLAPVMLTAALWLYVYYEKVAG
jgi:succinate dehydrogenase / fumarate reductase, cytochrome b subunit